MTPVVGRHLRHVNFDTIFRRLGTSNESFLTRLAFFRCL